MDVEKGGLPQDVAQVDPPPAYAVSETPAYQTSYGGQYNQGFVQGQHPPGQSAPYTVVTQPVHTNTIVQAEVPDHMALAIFVTICCCWPLGILAISKASEARAALARNDLVSAQLLGQSSRRISIYAIVCGFAIITTIVVVSVIAVQNTYTYTYED